MGGPTPARVGGRPKKAKIMFEPLQKVCFHCRKADEPGVLLRCKECETSVHLACLPSPLEHFGKDEEPTWKCSSHSKKKEKLCPAGDEKLPKKTRAFTQTRPKLDGKFRGFNADEARAVKDDSPSPLKKIEGAEQKNVESFHAGQSQSSIAVQSSIKKRSSVSSGNRHDDTAIPDGKEWSIEQVFEYFYAIFPEHAHAFKRKEIDGPALYVLKRSDVIETYNIKLGPALKIYGEILKLQTKDSDPTLSWY